ncbi:MAG: hypothetical protein NTX61_08230 [Bacteroidetes bacterium]|nr:hypothetical protein [Bacteroidota bacterium]
MKNIVYFLLTAVTIFLTVFLHPIAGASVAAVGAVGRITVNDLEDFAKGKLSSFDGNDGFDDFENYEEYEGFEGFENFDGFEGYTGYDDSFVDFGGFNMSFANAGDSGRIFVMTITNSDTTAAHIAYLTPGYFWVPGATVNGVVKTGAFNDTSGVAGLSGSGSPKVIEEFLGFIMHNPVAIHGIKVEGSVTAQVSQQLIIEQLSPFKVLQQGIINLGSYQNENTFRDKIVTVPTPALIVSNQVRISISIPAGCTTTFTWLAGAILNPSHALAQKMNKAKRTISRVGVKRAKKRPQLAAGH